MSKVFLATATKEASLKFKGEDHQASFRQFLKDHAGEEVRISLADKAVSEEMRGYYFGAVLPVVRKTCKEWEKLTGDELHAVLKKEHSFFEAWSNKNKRMERFAKEVFSADENETAKKFMQDISDYLTDCGIEMPDNESYKRWKNSAPLKEENYE